MSVVNKDLFLRLGSSILEDCRQSVIVDIYHA